MPPPDASVRPERISECYQEALETYLCEDGSGVSETIHGTVTFAVLARICREVSGAVLEESEQRHVVLLEEAELMGARLRNLTRQLLSNQEEERKRISRDLHDVIAQTLIGINIRLAEITRQETPDFGALRENIGQTRELVVDSIGRMHAFARTLRPPELDDLGLIAALHVMLEEAASGSGLITSMEAPADVEEIGIDKRTVLFRVAQEALNNTVRHSGAVNVSIVITLPPDFVEMRISDDGGSFDFEAQSTGSTRLGLGLLGMKERLEMVGGKLEVMPSPGGGTTVLATIPITSREP